MTSSGGVCIGGGRAKFASWGCAGTCVRYLYTNTVIHRQSVLCQVPSTCHMSPTTSAAGFWDTGRLRPSTLRPKATRLGHPLPNDIC